MRRGSHCVLWILLFLSSIGCHCSSCKQTWCSAIRYTVHLHVNCVLQSTHEDDHCAAAVFKYMWTMAVDLTNTQPVFACMDNKASVPYGEPGKPTFTSVMNPHSMVVAQRIPAAMDHGHTRGSFHPSSILPSTRGRIGLTLPRLGRSATQGQCFQSIKPFWPNGWVVDLYESGW